MDLMQNLPYSGRPTRGEQQLNGSQRTGGLRSLSLAANSCKTLHLLLGRVYDDKDVQERIVRRSKLDWVIVRPVILTNGPKPRRGTNVSWASDGGGSRDVSFH